MVKTVFNSVNSDKAGEGSIIGYAKICPLTGGSCNEYVQVNRNKIFLAESYNKKRTYRENAIKEVLDKMNMEIELADRKKESIVIFCKICRQIQSSYACLMDITELNPNVLIELGVAYGFQKPTIVMFKKQKKKKLKIPTDIQGIEYLSYNTYNDLKNQLQNAIKTLVTQYKPIVFPSFDLKTVFKLWKLLSEMNDLREVPKVINYMAVEGKDERLILNLGLDGGIKKGMGFYIHKLHNQLEDEESFGLIEITYVTETYSYGKIHTTNLQYIHEIEDHFSSTTGEEIPYVLKKISIDENILNNLV